jgi:carboxymethylenebutenolidase
MLRRDIAVRSSEGGSFDCYLATPTGERAVPAVVIASAVHGVDGDIRRIADEFASFGCIAAAPDLFWRSTPGPLTREDERAAQRAQPRLEKIRAGETDLVDVLNEVRRQPSYNGRAAVIGFCYGGPYAVIGPKRLGFDAGIACHGTQMLAFLEEFDGLSKPVCLIWGDRDQAAPAEVLDAYRGLGSRASNVDLHILPGLRHGYMMRGNAAAFDRQGYDYSMRLARASVEALAVMA